MNDTRHTPDENTTVLNTKDRTAGQKAAETKELLNQRERLLEKAAYPVRKRCR